MPRLVITVRGFLIVVAICSIFFFVLLKPKQKLLQSTFFRQLGIIYLSDIIKSNDPSSFTVRASGTSEGYISFCTSSDFKTADYLSIFEKAITASLVGEGLEVSTEPFFLDSAQVGLIVVWSRNETKGNLFVFLESVCDLPLKDGRLSQWERKLTFIYCAKEFGKQIGATPTNLSQN